MKAHIENDWESTDLVEGGLYEEPSLVFSPDMLEAIVRAASGVLPPTDATTAHLNDAIEVRNRLLSLVEEAL